MMLECSIGELLTRATFMQYAVLKGLGRGHSLETMGVYHISHIKHILFLWTLSLGDIKAILLTLGTSLY